MQWINPSCYFVLYFITPSTMQSSSTSFLSIDLWLYFGTSISAIHPMPGNIWLGISGGASLMIYWKKGQERWQFQIFRRKMYHGFEFSFPWSGELLIDMHDQTLKSDQFHLWPSLQQHSFRSIFLVNSGRCTTLYTLLYFFRHSVYDRLDYELISWDSQKSMDKKMRGWNSALLQV